MIAAPAKSRSMREELLDLLLSAGILQRSDSQPVLSRDGSSARWMLDSLAVTLCPRGAELAGSLIAERLRMFDGRQLATYGLTAVPIMQAAVLSSGGRHHGLLVRKDRKAHGSQKLIEGVIDPGDPVVLIEDSIASGAEACEGIAKLEAAGLRVEGVIALVRFGWEGGCSDLCERGYHVEAVYDIFEDLMARMEGEQGPEYNPTKSFPELRWSDRIASEGLHPAHLAREVLREYLSHGELLRPPRYLDRGDYDSAGGAWVSVRSRDDIHDRHARDGFWLFPGERSWGAPEDVVRASLRAAQELPRGEAGLALIDSSHIAVTFFSALERVTPGELDNERYGIVVVSGERPEIMGGALPKMPGIRDEWQQFRHARYNNAELYPYEPYVIYRHGVSKFVEPGAPWQSSGVPGTDERSDCGALAMRARDVVLNRPASGNLASVQLPSNAQKIFVTIYIDGEVRGCMGSEIGDLEQNITELTAAALTDERFEDVGIEEDSTVAVSVSVLSNELEMGDFSREEVRFRYRHGQQALMVDQKAREGMLLPFVASWLSLDAEDFVDEVLDKAGVTRPPYNWRRFDCLTWLADETGAACLEGGFKQAQPALGISQIARLHRDYVLRNQKPDGSLYFSYYPFENTLYQGIDMARLAHSAWTLARAGETEAALRALACISNQPDDEVTALSRDAFALLARLELSQVVEGADPCAIAGRLWDSVDRHGRITTWRPIEKAEDEDGDHEEETLDPEELQNYVPGQVLLALAAAAQAGIVAPQRDKLESAFRYYRHRFRYKRDFGQVSWMSLATAAWWRFSGNAAYAALLFEIVDWIIEFQQRKTGAFITDHQADTPGFTTAVYLEAVGAGFQVASAMGDYERARRYDDSWRRGFAFLDRLVIQERDSSVLPNPDYAYGGLRENLYSGHVRIDFGQHSLAAILERHPDALVNNQFNQENQNGNQETQEETRGDRRSCAG